VWDNDAFGNCMRVPVMSFSYYEGDCVQVEPMTPGTSTASKIVNCYQDADNNWWVNVRTYTDSDCQNQKASFQVQTGACSNDSNERYSVYACQDTPPQTWTQTCAIDPICQTGGVCVDGMPYQTCDCPAGTVLPICDSASEWATIAQYSSSNGSCSALSLVETVPQGGCVTMPDGTSVDVNCTGQSGAGYIQTYLDANCSEPYPYFVVQNFCARSPHGDLLVQCPSACDSFTCLEGGVCQINAQGPFCLCAEGFSGEHCENAYPWGSYICANVSGDGNEVMTSIVNGGGVAYATDGTVQIQVRPSVGYAMSPSTVGGTCPPGNWTGGGYTIEGVTADCSVVFSASPLP